jgi:hypothetical protein
MLLAFFTVASEGFAGAESDAVVWAADAVVEVWAGVEADVLAGGALDCCE